MNRESTRPRALIIGAGISGPVAAMFLQRAGWEVAVYEARAGIESEEGAFLNLAPNGINVLKLLGIDVERAAAGFPATGITFFNSRGQELGAIDSGDEEARFGARSVVLTRASLHRALHAAAAAGAGVPLHFGKRLSGIAQHPDAVVATFADGTTATGDILIGGDGIHSATRRLVLPEAPKPVYTGLVDCGAFARPTPAVPPTPKMRMIFGRKAFFGYLARPEGEVYWFCNIAWEREPARGELDAITSVEWRRRLSGMLAHEPDPIPRLVATTDEIGKWPIYDIPSLPAWHQGRVCLIGDAAHATSPHVGQGAATALEDAAELARCLRDIPRHDEAFAMFEGMRKGRVEKLVAQARRTGSTNAITNPVQTWVRDRMLGLFLRLGTRSNDWIYAYRVPWQEPVTSAESRQRQRSAAATAAR